MLAAVSKWLLGTVPGVLILGALGSGLWVGAVKLWKLSAITDRYRREAAATKFLLEKLRSQANPVELLCYFVRQLGAIIVLVPVATMAVAGGALRPGVAGAIITTLGFSALAYAFKELAEVVSVTDHFMRPIRAEGAKRFERQRAPETAYKNWLEDTLVTLHRIQRENGANTLKVSDGELAFANRAVTEGRLASLRDGWVMLPGSVDHDAA